MVFKLIFDTFILCSCGEGFEPASPPDARLHAGVCRASVGARPRVQGARQQDSTAARAEVPLVHSGAADDAQRQLLLRLLQEFDRAHEKPL